MNLTLYAWHMYYLWSVVFIVKAFFQIPSFSFRKKLKEDENEEKTIDGLQKKAKVNVKIDCFSLKKVGENCLKVSEKSGNF